MKTFLFLLAVVLVSTLHALPLYQDSGPLLSNEDALPSNEEVADGIQGEQDSSTEEQQEASVENGMFLPWRVIAFLIAVVVSGLVCLIVYLRYKQRLKPIR